MAMFWYHWAGIALLVFLAGSVYPFIVHKLYGQSLTTLAARQLGAVVAIVVLSFSIFPLFDMVRIDNQHPDAYSYQTCKMLVVYSNQVRCDGQTYYRPLLSNVSRDDKIYQNYTIKIATLSKLVMNKVY